MSNKRKPDKRIPQLILTRELLDVLLSTQSSCEDSADATFLFLYLADQANAAGQSAFRYPHDDEDEFFQKTSATIRWTLQRFCAALDQLEDNHLISRTNTSIEFADYDRIAVSDTKTARRMRAYRQRKKLTQASSPS